jgi:hypothetical protein
LPGLFTLPGRVVGWRGLFVLVGWGGWSAPRVCSFSLGGCGGRWAGVGSAGLVRVGGCGRWR